MMELLKDFKGKKVLVIGDFILDHHLYGRTERISREAPVLILKHYSEKFFCGGAGNAALNLSALGASVTTAGIIGDDEFSRLLISLLRSRGLKTIGFIKEKNRQTTVKTRIYGGDLNTKPQQVLRYDHSPAAPPARKSHIKLFDTLNKIFHRFDAVLISDYNSGSFSSGTRKLITKLLKKSKITSVVDSRYNMLDFNYFTAATPNETEVIPFDSSLEGNSSTRIWQMAINKMLLKTKSKMIIVTRGRQGMTLYERNHTPYSLDAIGDEDAIDVTGAGDTVSAVVTLGLASGWNAKKVVQIANIAGGIAVSRLGAIPVSADDIIHRINQLKLGLED